MFKKLQKTLLVFLAVGLVLAPGCASKQMVLSNADNGKQVSVSTGTQLAITLAGNPTTGYTWEARNLDTEILQQLGQASFKSSNPQLVGSGGTLTLTFKALKPGTTTLMLVYHRTFEANVAPLKTFSVTVTVK